MLSSRSCEHSCGRSKGKSVRRFDGEVLPAPDETACRVRSVSGRAGTACASTGARLGGAVGLWHGDPRGRRSLAHFAIGEPAGIAGGEGQRGGRGADGFADRRIVGGKMSGSSSGFSLPEVNGTVQLRNVRAALRGVNGPIEISSAELQLLPDEVRVEKLSARAADAHWTGSWPCRAVVESPGACLVRFNLNTEEVGLSELSEWLGSQPSQRRWYQMLTSAEPAAPIVSAELASIGQSKRRPLADSQSGCGAGFGFA